jgi:hypothetical protein
VVALSWHPSGSHLAILPRGQPFAMVWSASGELARLDSGVKVRDGGTGWRQSVAVHCPFADTDLGPRLLAGWGRL